MEQITSQDGTRIGYERTGTGSPLVLVHGGTADRTRWAPVLPALAEHFTTYAIDRRGRGVSGDANVYALEREFEDVTAVVDAIAGPVDLLGHSFGGVCALGAARRTPNVRRLVLYEPPPTGVAGTLPPAVANRMEALLASGDRDGVVSTFMREIVQVPPHELEKLRSVPAWQGRVAAAHTILREIYALEQQPPLDPSDLASFHIPTLLLLGGDSPAYQKANTEALHAALPNSRIVVMPGQQHIAMNTAPDVFVREVLAFLKEPS
jgi:pimeloyl-ACP methyl ester carboxylesterase